MPLQKQNLALSFVELQSAEAKSEICEQILKALPLWFGLPDANVKYIQDVKTMETWVAKADDKIIGFVALNKHNKFTAEIHVTGVLPEYHRRGVGAELMKACEQSLRKQGFKFFTVKTLSASRPDPNYDKTREFYLKVGFYPLEEFKTLWSEYNPCLMLAKSL